MSSLKKKRRLNWRGITLMALVPILIAGIVVSAVFTVSDVADASHPPVISATTTDPSSVTATTALRTLPAAFIGDNLKTPSAILYDLTAGAELFCKDADTLRYPASITKMLTAAVVVKYCDLEQTVTVGDELSLVARDSSVAGLKRGWQMTVRDLLYAMLLPSGNDAAYVLAVATARTVAGNAAMEPKVALERFAELMNKEAAAAGATASHFSNPDGYHAADHYTTARDLCKIIAYSLSYPDVKTVITADSVTCHLQSGQTVNWKSTNQLLDGSSPYYCPYAIGGKTGSTSEAGSCLFVLAEKNGREVIAIVLKASNNTVRFSEAKALIEMVL